MNRGRVSTQVFLCFLMMMFLMVIGGCSSGGGGSETTTPVSGESFTKGNITLKASVATSGSIKTVTVTDSEGKTVLTLNISTSTATFTFPKTSIPTIIDFQPPLSELPTDYTAKRMAIYAAGQISSSSTISSSSRKAYMNNPGCDWFPDTQCTLSCCAAHDLCYAENACTAKSFVVNFDGSFTTDCSKCNSIVMNCIAGACKGIDKNNTANNCYDTRCGKFYDCPPNYNTCGCKDICADSGITVPSTCGNGKCESEIGENTLSCPGDCVYCGNGKCDGGETPYSCPSDCGGCGTGPYECIPGSGMHYEPCLNGGVRECMSNCKFGPCMCGDNFDHVCGTCGDGTCDSGETSSSCPSDCKTCTYTYSSWSACQSNNTQTRTVVSQSPDGCTGTPVLEQSCNTPQTCTYTYSSWSACSNNTQTRTVLSSSPGGCTGTPVLSQSCTPPGGTPGAGNYTQSCTVTGTPITCCAGGTCSTVPAPPSSTYTNSYTVASGTSLSQLTSNVCSQVTAALISAGCSSWSCNNTAATSNSASFSLSCSVSSPGCTAFTVTETCTLSR